MRLYYFWITLYNYRHHRPRPKPTSEVVVVVVWDDVSRINLEESSSRTLLARGLMNGCGIEIGGVTRRKNQRS
jgi:hypothetical protein